MERELARLRRYVELNKGDLLAKGLEDDLDTIEEKFEEQRKRYRTNEIENNRKKNARIQELEAEAQGNLAAAEELALRIKELEAERDHYRRTSDERTRSMHELEAALREMIEEHEAGHGAYLHLCKHGYAKRARRALEGRGE